MSINIALICITAGVISWIITGFLRRYALARNIIDVPNTRSSHDIPTPRGGGLSIVIAFLGVLFFQWQSEFLTERDFWFLFVPPAWIALVGMVDDLGHIPARWRLLAHFFGAGGALFLLGGFPPVSIFGYIVNMGWMGQILALIYLVWLLNLYNFMDGIDGIAGVEAISVCLGGAVVYWIGNPDTRNWILLLLLFTSVAGFLFWNFPKARIFMGDAGSGFLGFMLGLFSLQAAHVAPEFFWAWIILLSVFIIDATVTLVRRILRGDTFYQAHRSHAYQILSRRLDSHVKVTISVLLINLFWLLPWAIFSVLFPRFALLYVLVAISPLVLIAIKTGAGTTNK